MKKICILCIFVLLYCFPWMLSADIIYLDEEKTMEGEIISETEDTVTVKMMLAEGGGDIVYTLSRADIKNIEKKPYGVQVEPEPKKEEPGYMKFLSGISERFSNVFNMKLSEENGISTAFSDIAGYLSSSFFIGIVVDLLIAVLAVSCISAVRMDGSDVILMLENTDVKKIAGRWAFVIFTLILVQGAKFGTFNFITSGWASIMILIIMLYETIGLIMVIFFRGVYIDVMKKANDAAPVTLKVPVALEFLALSYLFVMDILCMFL